MPRYGNEANFHVFFTSQNLKCTVSQSFPAKPYGFIRGTHVLSLNLTEKFRYLSSRRLNVTSSSLVPTFYNFLENIQNSNQSRIETVGN